MSPVQKRAEGELNDEDDEQEQHEAGESNKRTLYSLVTCFTILMFKHQLIELELINRTNYENTTRHF